MRFTPVFFAFFGTALILAFVQNVAVQLSLYWTYLWFDIPMHFLGGVVVALGYQAFFSAWVKNENSAYARFVPTIVTILMVGLLWEVYEVLIDVPIGDRNLLDTLLDIVMDLTGGLCGYIIARYLVRRG